MTKAKNPRKLLPFDATRYLTDDAAIAEYMNAVLETNDPDLLRLALGDIAGGPRGAEECSPGREPGGAIIPNPIKPR